MTINVPLKNEFIYGRGHQMPVTASFIASLMLICWMYGSHYERITLINFVVNATNAISAMACLMKKKAVISPKGPSADPHNVNYSCKWHACHKCAYFSLAELDSMYIVWLMIANVEGDIILLHWPQFEWVKSYSFSLYWVQRVKVSFSSVSYRTQVFVYIWWKFPS